ncbi:phospholipase D alpha 4 [Senna tora]|uniref:Phospholipase D alpha 4 n=1 Tax=Senna tora TaxID=362788 RepID=A0A834XGF5_9FABA|nr:phospholipase D alpha 4 [Senna tora]
MDGQRDTEIAIGCYQSQDGSSKSRRHGEIQSYRMSLWYEHSGCAEESLLEPESMECVEKMRAIGDRMWRIYSGDEIVDMEGVHLVTYPLKVTMRGGVEDLEDCGGCFPDTHCPVKGKRSKMLPPIFTT